MHVNMHCRAVDDMVILAHIREQHRLNLQSYALHGRVLRSNVPRGGQQPHVQHRPKSVGLRFLSDWPQSEMGWRHQLHLDQ